MLYFRSPLRIIFEFKSKLKKKSVVILIVALFSTSKVLPQKASGHTYCNPLNISYRFSFDKPSHRELADPAIVLYKDNYFLFASKAGGYWYSKDLLNWNFVTTTTLPIENYAPTAVVINNSLYWLANGTSALYRTDDPISGKWEIANSSFPGVGDPDLFVDSDGRVYFYYGLSNNDYIKGVELDVKNNLSPKGKTVNLFKGNPSEHGWERFGDYNESNEAPWIEASWMIKYNGTYYLQYSAPGTQFKSYAEGYYTADKPLGPFTYAPNNPFSAKPEGFIAGAGHGATFMDKYGNWWNIATMSVSVKDRNERRLGLFPVTFDKQGLLVAHTEFSDYPIIMPNHKYNDVSELFPGWMMLSYKKVAEASSSLDAHPTTLAFDENIRDYWSAQTGDKGEWLSVDMGSQSTVNAVQINFAENNTHLFGRKGVLSHQYLVEYSADNKTWKTLVDKTANTEDLTHLYDVMKTPLKARYLKITNYRVPGGTFAISGFRVFGSGTGKKPKKVSSFKMLRDSNDPRTIKLSWAKKPNAIGYNIRFGTQPDKLYRSYKVYNDTLVTIRSLNKDEKYWFAIDAFGENGVIQGDTREAIMQKNKVIHF
jgi:xylan 1,4-beta-xylosidase